MTMLTIEPTGRILGATVRVLWDHLGTWHYARPDRGPDERRLKRCQVLATKIFNPDFLRESLLTAHDVMEPAHG
jgi:hypothetical protein